ncbi:MAG: type II toxin-antitoxin system RelE/ParE family toxin [Burkholderiales bacterium]|uniref:Type II toxin-antitoxin system RelE/ParE family toxin n=1 Tax=Ottowia pentelensis TaxID=511108 RepID=A0ABV6PZ77_9BURK|nr:type II toxin-antitoxin system RelE/ParE family toxin [Ottowia sp.]MBN9404930.1 type II toxin-antitoxin system RelE/ParE family toxin [Burkholderiales bacterium]MBS0402506.1 type II toxin-antitoxin system RelE/ParE family toxin [Pseudomonadota bacterium]MBS0414946.1 type II toxin-antitoxin system RelE/ParE family toxin [Pseudomonadota bacterium]HMN57296.1 type II toxin-antitoxin system RelE/ParE family toxin [Ottowia sp.]
MPYTIAYYNPSVQAGIEAWPSGISASYVRIVEQMVVSGPNLGLPYTRPFGDGLFEIRAKAAEGIGRAFFCSLVGQRIVILHGFIKKTQQTPHKELKLARRRLKEVLHG